MILGGNHALRTNSEILSISKNSSSICTQPANIPEEHSDGAIGDLFNHKIKLCGGWLAGTDCHEYSFETQSWEKASYSLLNERAEAAGSMLENGTWIIIGGKGLDTVPLPTSEYLEDSIFVPGMPWSEAVSGHCMEKINKSHIFIAGGESYNSGLLDSTYILKVDHSYWFPMENRLSHKRSGHVCGIANEKSSKYIIVAGGSDLFKTELINVGTMEFSKGPELPFKMNWAATLHIDGKMLIFGGEHIGYCSKPNLCFSSDAIFELSIKNSTWKLHHQALRLPRSKHMIMTLPNDTFKLCQNECPNCKGKH